MRRIAILATLTAVGSGASAQSSVTLFGTVDASARYVQNGSVNQYSLGSSGINSSRIGFKGIEELGGGLKAGFWLEAAVSPENGSAGDGTRLFNRRSTVSLIGRFGELRLGRDYVPTYYAYEPYSVFGNVGIATSGKFNSNLGSNNQDGVRADNQIIYLTPKDLGGLSGRFAVAAAEGRAGSRLLSGQLGYAAGPLDVSIAFGQTRVTPVAGSTQDAFRTFGGGVTYDFGFVKAEGYYRQNRFAQLKVEVASVGAIVPIGSGEFKVAYTRANTSGQGPLGARAVITNQDANDANQYALGYIYNLSKRTALYGTGSYVQNKGNANFVLLGGPPINRGENSRGVEFGIRHFF